jgi:hypothetical protein
VGLFAFYASSFSYPPFSQYIRATIHGIDYLQLDLEKTPEQLNSSLFMVTFAEKT